VLDGMIEIIECLALALEPATKGNRLGSSFIHLDGNCLAGKLRISDKTSIDTHGRPSLRYRHTVNLSK
jgi:hypothetical protein